MVITFPEGEQREVREYTKRWIDRLLVDVDISPREAETVVKQCMDELQEFRLALKRCAGAPTTPWPNFGIFNDECAQAAGAVVQVMAALAVQVFWDTRLRAELAMRGLDVDITRTLIEEETA